MAWLAVITRLMQRIFLSLHDHTGQDILFVFYFYGKGKKL